MGFYVETYKQVCGKSSDFLDLLYEVRWVMYDSDFPMRGSICARKRDKLYIEECMVLTIGLRRRMFGLCTFDSPYSLMPEDL